RLNLLDRQPISTQSHQRQTPLIVTPDAVAVLVSTPEDNATADLGKGPQGDAGHLGARRP
ncbi:hypothetical protein, partial [Streptomyces sp. NPDC047453]|uniref:hypothetical protein n=1 Tax=Streptomyces sp. NPDC047453 TaxID=3154812 RepID=UPI0033C2209E